MPDTPIVIVEHARRRTAQVRAGDVPTAMRDGPKWVCRIVPDHAQSSREGHRSMARTAEMLGRLKPASVVLTDAAPSDGGSLVRSSTDGAGRCRAYAHLCADRILEMVGMPAVGPWLDEHDAWWPGAYELPLLEQLSANDSPLHDLFGASATVHLLMSLTEVDGTALVTESDDGIERPFRIPAGVDTIHFAPVCIRGPAAQWRETLVTAFDSVRHLVGLRSTRPFYL
ncbi:MULTISPECIES: hypothetical protein [Burkholderia cepacia complex]|uniref:Uncharacterized protein n=2 Tax=Burkholderia TaxID=32008 RepID=B1KCF5_BURO0|nr:MULTISPECIES: hypothetical protein [Burkholderia cepacia complex]ACA95902.1 conserved hypothetical protein [Burkholderia orbicola MC0-3]KWU23461.1 hypothetical protein AS149_36755 [Burkholderia cenocepacia]RQV54729.1 hypothetical protein DF024_32080 [Burkholderia cenocepacia]